MKERVIGLDILRFVAIVLVCMLHGREILAPYFPNFLELWFVDGVDVFFTLSGFLIGTIFIKEFSLKTQIYFSDLFRFLKRRWFRTLPLYFLILLINIGIVYSRQQNFQIKDLWKYFFFLQNFSVVQCYHFLTESWSLAVEEWFYVVFPFLCLFMSFFWKTQIKRIILFTSMLIITISIIAKNVYALNLKPLDIGEWIRLIRNVVLFRLDSIIYGILGAYIAYYHHNLWKKYRIHSLVIGLLFIYLKIRFYILDSNLKMVNQDVIASISLMLLLPYFSELKSLGLFNPLTKFITFTSKISYSMYLVNFSIVLSLMNRFLLANSPRMAIMNYFLFWFFTITISFIFYNYFEKPTTALRNKY